MPISTLSGVEMKVIQNHIARFSENLAAKVFKIMKTGAVTGLFTF